MTLTNLRNFPPGGYKYFEPSIPWRNPDPSNGEGIAHAARLLQMARAQNPDKNLDPSYDACVDAIAEYTCARLKRDFSKETWSQWCADTDGPAVNPNSRSQISGCATCGGRNR
jgi:hypothetical protein